VGCGHAHAEIVRIKIYLVFSSGPAAAGADSGQMAGAISSPGSVGQSPGSSSGTVS
jgi:hypothetical protein